MKRWKKRALEAEAKLVAIEMMIRRSESALGVHFRHPGVVVRASSVRAEMLCVDPK